MNNHECYCILVYFNGSWILDALTLDEAAQQQVVDEYVKAYSQEELDAVVKHVDSEFSLRTRPCACH